MKLDFSSKQYGYTLLEVLISMVILAIGLLGMAAMMLNSIKSNQGALHRSEATLYAYEVLDLMRANRIAAEAGEYSIAIGASSARTTIAEIDLDNWKDSLSQLPLGDGSISQSGGIATITVQWDESRMQGGAIQSFTYMAEY